MQWLNEPVSWQRSGDVLQVDVDPGTDFWRVTGYGYVRDSGHLYGELIVGDLDLEVRVRGAYAGQNDQAGLMLRADEQTWLKAGVEFFGGRPRLSTVLTLGLSSWMVAELPDGVGEVALRVLRRGEAVEVRYAADDGPLTLAALVCLPPEREVMAGVMCAAPESGGFRATFRDFRLTAWDGGTEAEEAEQGGQRGGFAGDAQGGGFAGDAEGGEWPGGTPGTAKASRAGGGPGAPAREAPAGADAGEAPDVVPGPAPAEVSEAADGGPLSATADSLPPTGAPAGDVGGPRAPAGGGGAPAAEDGAPEVEDVPAAGAAGPAGAGDVAGSPAGTGDAAVGDPEAADAEDAGEGPPSGEPGGESPAARRHSPDAERHDPEGERAAPRAVGEPRPLPPRDAGEPKDDADEWLELLMGDTTE